MKNNLKLRINPEKDCLGDRLRAARVDAGLSQLELSRKIKCALTSIVRWENDINPPVPGKIKAIARACKVPVDVLTSGMMRPRKADKTKVDRYKKEIGKRLRLLRGTMPQTEFSKKLSIVLNAYMRYESGKRSLHDFQIITICQLCGVSANWLLFGKERKNRRAIPAG